MGSLYVNHFENSIKYFKISENEEMEGEVDNIVIIWEEDTSVINNSCLK